MEQKQQKKQEPVKTYSAATASGKMVLGKENYYLILFGAIVIVIGFILMSGGKYTDPNVFNGEELFNTRRTVIAPIVVILGFIIEIWALFYKGKKS
ncbi:MAG: DUF3098 domain-containing protein [Chitinophagales bacterium]|nr:DUF3098 domain-containing protein [Chitinophagales bacterium]